ncbi:MAG TPA: DUF6788 family protein [Anaeromyxobacteraceae bacterium]|nr:DUF6788 family protein [Anaeromyxobacteraceae bacterium]
MTQNLEDPVLVRYREQYRELTASLGQLGYFCKGTVLSRTLKCGRATCPCANDPKKRHGPYFEWTYKVAGKTVHHRLSAQEAKIYEDGAAEYRRLKLLLRRMEDISRSAFARQAAASNTEDDRRTATQTARKRGPQ